MSKIYPKFGGVLINDASWDVENVIVGVPYSQYIASVLRPGRIPGQKDPVTEKPKVTWNNGNQKPTVGYTTEIVENKKDIRVISGGDPWKVGNGETKQL